MENETTNSGQEQAQTTVHDNPFVDGISEEEIGRLYQSESEETTIASEQDDVQNEQPDAVRPEAEKQEEEEQKPADQKHNDTPGDDEFILPLAAGETKLTGNEVCDLVELGMVVKQQGQRIQDAFAFQERMTPLVQAMQSDPGLVAYLEAYGKGKQENPAQHDPYAGNDEVVAFEQHILQRAAEMLLPKLTEQVEAKYQPFVQNMESFAAQTKAEKTKAAFDSLRTDPDFESVNADVFNSVGDSVSKGKITPQEASVAYQALQNDPDTYRRVFDYFKGKRSGSGQGIQKQVAPAQEIKQIRKVVRAPRLEKADGVAGDAKAMATQKNFQAALGSGDPEAIGRLF